MEKFWSQVEKTDSCWRWTGRTKRHFFGYGVFRFYGRNVNTHRVSWILTHGEIPNGLCVLHKCDVPECVNPDHLFLGTHADNCKDRHAKGRTNNAPGRAAMLIRKAAVTHCPRGHEYTPENTRYNKFGWRNCRICIRKQDSESRQRKKRGEPKRYHYQSRVEQAA